MKFSRSATGRSSAGKQAVCENDASPASRASNPIGHSLQRGIDAFSDAAIRAWGANTAKTYGRARKTVRIYYIALLVLAVYHGFDLTGRQIPVSSALWPVVWAPWLGAVAVPLIRVSFIGGALLAAIVPDRRWARLLAFVGCLQFGAFINSFGKVNHSLHLWVCTAFLLVFLTPPKRHAAPPQREYLQALWFAQAFVLMTYSMAGLAKLRQGIFQWLLGAPYSVFSPESMAIHVAEHLLRTGRSTILGPTIIEWSGVGYALLLTTIYLELTAFAVAFRPALHRVWGLALIMMHVGIYLTMGINFIPAIIIDAILLCGSPFRAAASRSFTRHPVLQLPGLPSLVRLQHLMRRTT